MPSNPPTLGYHTGMTLTNSCIRERELFPYTKINVGNIDVAGQFQFVQKYSSSTGQSAKLQTIRDHPSTLVPMKYHAPTTATAGLETTFFCSNSFLYFSARP